MCQLTILTKLKMHYLDIFSKQNLSSEIRFEELRLSAFMTNMKPIYKVCLNFKTIELLRRILSHYYSATKMYENYLTVIY